MTEHAISIQPQPSTVTASTLAELLKQTGTNTLQFTQALTSTTARPSAASRSRKP